MAPLIVKPAEAVAKVDVILAAVIKPLTGVQPVPVQP